VNWSAYLCPGDGAIDIGANVGTVTRRLAEAVGPTGHVLAVEPDPRALTVLRAVLITCPWVTILESAVIDSVGVAEMHLSQDSRHNSLWKANMKVDTDRAITVPTTTLDRLAASVPNLKAIKVDTQGAESLVLSGARKTLTHDLVWHVEVWPHGLQNAGSSADALLKVFRDAGYRPVDMTWDQILTAQHGSPHGATDVVFTR